MVPIEAQEKIVAPCKGGNASSKLRKTTNKQSEKKRRAAPIGPKLNLGFGGNGRLAMLQRITWLMIGTLCCAATASSVLAEERTSPMPPGTAASLRWAEVNRGNVWIISGGINGTYIRLADDLAAVLDDEEGLRVLPVRGKGSVQNINDMLYLKGIDIGIVQSDVLSYVKREGIYRNVENRVRYITTLYNEEFHLLAGQGIESVEALAGKKVNFGIRGSGTYVTASTVFDALGIKVEPTAFDQALALEKVKAGDIAALVYVAGKPTSLIKDLKSEDGVRLLRVRSPKIPQIYAASKFAAEDYPGLVPPGTEIDTIAVRAVMAAYNWTEKNERYQNIARFVDRLFERFAEFQIPPRHPKWREVDLSAELPGWVRFKAAADWLRNRAATVAAAAPKTARDVEVAPSLEAAFRSFLAQEAARAGGSLSQEKEDELFQKFLRWKDSPAETTFPVHLTAADGVGRRIGTITAKNLDVLIDGLKEPALLLKPNLAGLAPGPHAFRLYENAACGPGEKDGAIVPGLAAGNLLYAGGTGSSSGKKYRIRLGDLPDLLVATDGTAKAEVVVPRLTTADLLGRAIVVHVSQDDGSARQACGAVK